MERKLEEIPLTNCLQYVPKIGFTNGYYLDIESQIDNQITSFLFYSPENLTDLPDLPTKRGRKKLRPLNPTKTEIMDKFWLRGFRDFIKMNQTDLRPYFSDQDFWAFFLSRAGNPGKKRKYLSYSKEYKKFLSSNKSFCQVFIAWMMLYGNIKIPRKNFKGNWELYYDYLCTDLVQPCKNSVSALEVKESLKLLAGVYQKYFSYVNEQIKQISIV